MAQEVRGGDRDQGAEQPWMNGGWRSPPRIQVEGEESNRDV